MGFRFFLCLLAVLPAHAQLSISQTADAITVRSAQGVTWSATIDLTQGGAIREFRIPQNGPNLVHRDMSFFNLFAMTSEKINGRTIKAWSSTNGRLATPKIEKSSGRIVVAVQGKAQSKLQETFFDYTHTYIFRPEGI